ncbi:RecQ family ATP-dependent DNA helicase [Riemerella columbina]|uniref:RecQ family ATP-dependent DNA helicase n=1 Tax=Riemerella columbina TaxID=103810 RepID=UPI00267066E7|nr:ATP-dependent DNA helicase RecQ [Riemerella columbina]WKS95724.1 RecQ family ATP-dependent DNA helicase [Riemerella columbina]
MPYTRQQISTLIEDTLAHFWGYSTFRDAQKDIIFSILNHRDTLALLPTGGGKSLCYQLPALVLEGTCLVVSPLLALMKDQVGQLKQRGIEAEYLSSELEEDEAETIYARCIEGITKILFVSPERLKNMVFLSKVEEMQISFLAVDEAHCISEWGQDFRPSYQNIEAFRKDKLSGQPVLALTATATPKVVEDIKTKLGLQSPQIFQKSFKRDNISIYTEATVDKYARVFHLLKNNPATGIIYTATRKQAEQLSEYLNHSGLSQVDYYHAGLSLQDKNRKQAEWLTLPNRVLVATNAFGMGIDKEDVRFVIHFSPPTSLENYYQEIGRAGRDGQPSFAVLLWSEDEISRFDGVLYQQIPSRDFFKKAVSYLYSLFQIADYEQAEGTFQFNIQSWQRVTRAPLPMLNNILTFLHNQEIIYYNARQSKSSVELTIEVSDFELLPKSDAYFIETLLRNLSGFSTHKVYFREEALAQKLHMPAAQLKEHLQSLKKRGFVHYIDGGAGSIKFLIPRDEQSFGGKWWHLFFEIQRNKVQKWEEMKYFIQNRDRCKMQLILSYFGEATAQNCGHCSVCLNRQYQQEEVQHPALLLLAERPQTLLELAAALPQIDSPQLLRDLIKLLNEGKIKMLNYKTYTLNP